MEELRQYERMTSQVQLLNLKKNDANFKLLLSRWVDNVQQKRIDEISSALNRAPESYMLVHPYESMLKEISTIDPNSSVNILILENELNHSCFEYAMSHKQLMALESNWVNKIVFQLSPFIGILLVLMLVIRIVVLIFSKRALD